MILFDLICSNDHTFEAWFPSSDDFEKQRKGNKIECPVCGDTKVNKALMAPAVSGAKNGIVYIEGKCMKIDVFKLSGEKQTKKMDLNALND